MKRINFRIKNNPNRRTIIITDYTHPNCRVELRKDFNYSCGYCDCHESSEGAENFEIDHFKPKNKKAFPNLKNEYSNLVYSCKTCNRAKSSKWKDDTYVDPCDNTYCSNFQRNDRGKIFPNSNSGSEMWKDFKLYLLKRKYNWQLSQINNLLSELENLKEMGKISEEFLFELEKRYSELYYYLGVVDRVKKQSKKPILS